jgi:hypothetical protein
MINARKFKESVAANRKNRSRKSRRGLVMNDMIQELGRELRLIDKALVALTKLLRLRQQS